MRLSVTVGVVVVVDGTCTVVENRFDPLTWPFGPVKNVPPAGGSTVFTDLFTCCWSMVMSTIELLTSSVKVAGGAWLLLPSEKFVTPANSTVAPPSGARKSRKNSRDSPPFSWPIEQVTVFDRRRARRGAVRAGRDKVDKARVGGHPRDRSAGVPVTVAVAVNTTWLTVLPPVLTTVSW